MPSCRQVVFSSQAYLSIISETYSFRDVETGGIFLGTIENSIWYVVEIIDPGYQGAIRRSAYFEYDVNYVTHLANVRKKIYKNELILLGLWHRHPGSFDKFSHTDDETNLRFAKLNDLGSISALVNLDPDFRLTVYHVHQDLRYSRIQNVEYGDSHIPNRLLEIKGANSYLAENTKYYPSTITTKKNSSIRNISKFLKKPSDRKIPHERVLDMLDIELDDYLEKQTDYSYEIKTIGQKVLVTMDNLGGMAGYPKNIRCFLYIDNKGQNICSINNDIFPYKKGVVREFVNNKIAYAASQQLTNNEITNHMRMLNVNPDSSDSEIKEAYRGKLKDYHPDNWVNDENKNVAINATKETRKIIESYETIKAFRKNAK